MRASFLDELTRLEHPGLTKQARVARLKILPDKIWERLAVGGALTGAAGHGLQSVEADLKGNPYLKPTGGVGDSAKRGLLAGLLVAGGIKGLGRMSKKKLR